MIYGITKQILDALSPFLSEEDVEITAEKHILDDGSAPEYGDKVILDKENNVWFEVFENEIVLFYFTDHEHFDDYMERPRDGEPDYVERATDFLQRLFTLELRKTETVAGNDMLKVEYAFVSPDGSAEFLGGTWKQIADAEPRNEVCVSTWKFDKAQKKFSQKTE